MSGNPARDLEAWLPHVLDLARSLRAGNHAAHTTGHRYRAETTSHVPLEARELKALAREVQELSLGLTRDRALPGTSYMDTPRHLAAYLAWFWPNSYAQVRAVLPELPPFRSVLDLGGGPGPAALACVDAGASDVTCADMSRAALDVARSLSIRAGVGLSVRHWTPAQPLDRSWDLIILGHSLNELFGRGEDARVLDRRATFLEGLLGHLTATGTLLVIDPALRETTRSLLAVRDRLVARGHHVLAPCLFRGPCPALERPTDWCHAERRWSPPQAVRDLARATGLQRDSLKLSYLALIPAGRQAPPAAPSEAFRIVSEPLRGKGRLRYMGCGPTGRIGLALQERFVTEASAVFAQLGRGDVIEVTGTERAGDGLSLGPDSTVTRVAWAGQKYPP